MQDTFQITTLGIRELNRRPQGLTVGYLQGFYRGKVHRGAGSDDSTSEAERILYEKFESLPDAFTVFHSVKWFARERGSIGEIDFLIAHPQYGLLVMEVKGGYVSIEKGGWHRQNPFTGKSETMRDPCKQADRNRWALLDWLKHDPRTRKHHYAIFPAIALPDSQVDLDIRPDCPADIMIDIRHLDDLEGRLMTIYQYWASHADTQNHQMGGQTAIDALVELLVPTRKLQPSVAEIFERERRKIEELTQQQFRVLRMLRRYKRAAIVGGAGTGKTMLAMEKAVQLANAGNRVLFVCFNRQLAEWVGQHIADEDRIIAATFHSVVGYMINQARLPRTGRGWQEFTKEAPELLLNAIDIIRAPDSGLEDRLFDAILVDEAQDFEDDWWIGLLNLLKDLDNGILYVFYDDNQRIFTPNSSIPLDSEPFYLDENCRNTQHIHTALEPYTTDVDVLCVGPEGRPVEFIPAEDNQAARKALQGVLHRLVNEEGVAPEDIIILTPASEKRSQWQPDDQLGNFILTWNMETEMSMAIRVSSIYRYKGLESAVVILTEAQFLKDKFRNPLIYVGLSRARHHAVVIGNLPDPSE